MRIAIEFSKYKGEMHSGAEVYARKLIKWIESVDKTNKYVVINNSSKLDDFCKTTNFKTKVINSPSAPRLDWRIKIIAKPIADFLYTPIYKHKVFRHGEFDIVHFPFSVIYYKIRSKIPKVLTLHDIGCEYYPSFSGYKLNYRRKTYRYSCRAATKIIVPSEFTKKTIVEKYGIEPDKISVVYLGCDFDFNKISLKTAKKWGKKRGLPDKFLFYPAATRLRKNHHNLLKAFKMFKDKYGLNIKLVLSGNKRETYPQLKEQMKELSLSDDIFMVYVDYDEMPYLYSLAHALVFPSLFEGFGIPVVEAMNSSTPIACSDRASLPEVAGDAVLYFDPETCEDIAEKLYLICEDISLREKLIEEGLKRGKVFTWEKTAQETIRIYEELCRK